MLQQVDYWTSGAGFHLFALIALTENAAGDKKRALARSQAPLYNSNLQIPQGSPPSRQVRRLKPETIFIMGNPEMSTNTGELICEAPDITEQHVQYDTIPQV